MCPRIRSLSTTEIRARTLGGRLQISEGGKHLVDGVPFGRPMLRTPNRPHIHIPPRKRQRMLGDDKNAQASAEFYTPPDAVMGDDTPQSRLLLIANGETSKDSARLQNGQSPGALRDPSLSNGTATDKSVRFGELPLTYGDYSDDDDDEDDDDFAPQYRESDDGDMESNSDDSSDDSSNDSSTSSSISGSGSSSTTSDSDTNKDSDSDSNSDSDSGSSSESESESDEDSSRDSEASSGPEIISSKAPPLHTPPGRGKSVTRARNKRRSLSKKLTRLKTNGILDSNATLKDVRVHLQPAASLASKDTAVTNGTNQEGPVDEAVPLASKKRKRGDEEATPSEQAAGQLEHDWEADLERRKQLLLQNLESLDQSTQAAEVIPQDSATKRLRPDVSAIGRILKQQTRVCFPPVLVSSLACPFVKHPMQPAQKKLNSKPSITFEESPTTSNPDLYKSKLHISAFETYHEGYVLEPPPFPFKQHWDRACKIMYPLDRADKAKNGRKYKYLHSTYTAPHVAPTSASGDGYEETNTPEESPEESPKLRSSDRFEEKVVDAMVLDYGDAPNLDSDAGAIESQIREDVATAAQMTDLPPLPEDTSTLPALSPSDILPGAIIAFKFLMMNPSPEISDFVTGVVERLADPIPIKLAMRDKEKMFDKAQPDEEEPSFLGGIDMDINGQDVVMYMQFDFLHDPRLLKAADA